MVSYTHNRDRDIKSFVQEVAGFMGSIHGPYLHKILKRGPDIMSRFHLYVYLENYLNRIHKDPKSTDEAELIAKIISPDVAEPYKEHLALAIARALQKCLNRTFVVNGGQKLTLETQKSVVDASISLVLRGGLEWIRIQSIKGI